MAGEAERIVVLDPNYGDYEAEHAVLDSLGCRLEVFEGERHDVQGRIAFAQGAPGLLIRWTEFDGAVFDALPELRYLVRYGVGYDNIDVAAATAHGVMVCNVQGYANHAVSDHALALLLACARDLKWGVEQLRPLYNGPPRDHLPELHEMTLGIVGLGRIGGTLCTKARALFRRILACDPYIVPERFQQLGAEACSFDRLLAESDAVSIHCNLTDETRGMFSADAIGRMRPGAILVNTARGPVVDEDALLPALESGRLFALGLDVYDDEPPLANRDALLSHPHVIATGHYAWYSSTSGRTLQRRAAEHMAAMLRGKIPEDCLNPEAFR